MIIVDGHSDIPRDVYLKELSNRTNVFMNDHYANLKKAGLNIIFANVFTKTHEEVAVNESLLQIEKLINASKKYDDVVIIKNKKDIAHVIETGKLGIILSIEGFEPLNDTLDLLTIYYELGLRAGMLTWNHANSFASGSDYDEGKLTTLGISALKKMNELGILVDVSHLNQMGFWDVIEHNKKLTIASHSNAKALYNHRRNLTDEQMIAIAKSGGVIGAVSYFSKVCETDSNMIQLEDDITETIDDYIEHVEYMINLVGYDHVGFGFDFNIYLGDFGVKGLESVENVKDVIKILLDKGHRLEDISKISGGNFLRVLNEILN
jgi:membrane dipeptidase